MRRVTPDKPQEAVSPAQVSPASNGSRTPGKGRPTPKQVRRSGPPAPPPKTRREAYRRTKEQNATHRSRTREAMRTGDERYLPKRDRGPVRGLVRDVIDSRRNAGGVFILVAIVVFITYLVPSPLIKSVGLALWASTFVLMILDSIYLGIKIRRLANERFADQSENTSGLVWYGITRALMLRRWRMPAPQVEIGSKI